MQLFLARLCLGVGAGGGCIMIGTQLVKVLIIDDHEVVRLGVKQILKKALPHVEIRLRRGRRVL